jgi:hypothetical protein
MFGHPSNDWPTLLNFWDRAPKRTDRSAIELFRVRIIYVKLDCTCFFTIFTLQVATPWNVRACQKDFYKLIADFSKIVQSTAYQTIHFGLCTALISRVLALILNWKCTVWLSVARTVLRNKPCISTLIWYFLMFAYSTNCKLSLQGYLTRFEFAISRTARG